MGPGGGGGGVRGRHVHGPRDPRDPPNPSPCQRHNQPHAPTMQSSANPIGTPSNRSDPPPRGGGGRAGGRTGKLPAKEEANNCLSTNKGLPRVKEHTAPNQDKPCNSDWVYYSLAMATRETGRMEPKV